MSEDGLLNPAFSTREATKLLEQRRKIDLQAAIGPYELTARLDDTPPFFNIPPVIKRLILADEPFCLALAHYCRFEVPYPTCEDVPRALQYDHSQRCHRCGGPYRLPRHQAALAAFRGVCAEYGIQTTDNFWGVFGATTSQKRPDVVVFRSATDDCPLVLDVTCPHQSADLDIDAVQTSWGMKNRKYVSWHSDSVLCAPFVVSTFSTIHTHTSTLVRELEKQAIRRGFARDCLARVKLAVARFEHHRRKALIIRQKAGRLKQGVPDPELVAVSDSEE